MKNKCIHCQNGKWRGEECEICHGTMVMRRHIHKVCRSRNNFAVCDLNNSYGNWSVHRDWGKVTCPKCLKRRKNHK